MAFLLSESATWQEFKTALAHVACQDFSALNKKCATLKHRQKNKQPSDRLAANLRTEILKSAQKVEQRQKSCPKINFTENLPVNQKLNEIEEKIKQHQVVIICGETGSGKTTQIPKICLKIGRGFRGKIGHTQPRRLAARSVAQRIAQELQQPLGQAVAYKVRFNETGGAQSLIKLMTDGILLAETQNDPLLSQYDTIIIDEAHERSLNIDFLLGYLKKIMPRRPDLKIIITSATIDATRFSEHFFNAPIIEVSGRSYPVEILYAPLKNADDDETELAMEDAIVAAAEDLQSYQSGDVLVFLPGEREIRDTADKLRQAQTKLEILPLFARLSNEEQNRIFQPHDHARIILATNVAETSLTVPGIRYVIDTGLARVKRYSPRARVEQLRIEKISQAAAKQRAGRCGRMSDGICVRLYSEDDFAARPEFTDPEIVRSPMAAVILKMAALKLGVVQDFPFLDAPSGRLIADGYQALFELGAIDENKQLTSIGHELARLPIDPKIGRILLAGNQHHCLREILIICAALSIQDPRERPFDAREAAQKAHAKFVHEKSDFLSFLQLWDFFEKELENQPSHRKIIKSCHTHFLSHRRMREWRDLYQQLKQISEELGFFLNETPATYEQIHRALLSGLLSQIAFKSAAYENYLGTKGVQFQIATNSGLRKSKAKWIMAAELTDTHKIYARTVASIEPEWLEHIAAHLIKYHYFNPHWDEKKQEVIVNQKLTMFGLPILQKNNVNYGKINPNEARDIFIREALIPHAHQIEADFIAHNQTLIAEIEALEHKSRRQEFLINDQILFAFYHRHLPEHVFDARSLLAWLKKAAPADKNALKLNKEDLLQNDAHQITEALFPEKIKFNDIELKLKYRFEPKHPLDGITVFIPLPQLNRLPKEAFDWLVPGMIREKITLLIKSLPKNIRRHCVPVPDFVTEFLSSNPDTQLALNPQLAKFIENKTKEEKLLQVLDFIELPEHLKINFCIIDDQQETLGMSRDFKKIHQQFSEVAQLSFRDQVLEFERENIETWDFGDLPKTIHFARGTEQLVGFPALSFENETLAIRLFDTETAAEQSHRLGILALMQKQLKAQYKQLQKDGQKLTQTALAFRHFLNKDELLTQSIEAIFIRAVLSHEHMPREEQAFLLLKERTKTRLPAIIESMKELLKNIAEELTKVQTAMHKHALEKDISEHLALLFYPQFLIQTPWENLCHYPRYLRAILMRINKYQNQSARDKKHQIDLKERLEKWQNLLKIKQKNQEDISEDFLNFRWHLEEMRVSLFAQELKTAYPISFKRLDKTWQEII